MIGCRAGVSEEKILIMTRCEEYRQLREAMGRKEFAGIITEQLNDIVTTIENKDSSLNIITAPPGSGKTFLLCQLEEWAKDRRELVLFEKL
jgi:ATP/maltotriose-dependent transcriptional regulator MalT